MRIIAGRWRGRALVSPPGLATRPTSDRARQAIFDQLWHAPWAGRDMLEGATVLDAFAGTGAMGLEALSRGAARGFFMEQDRAALAALRANITACKAGDACRLMAGDVTAPPHRGGGLHPGVPRPALWQGAGAARAGCLTGQGMDRARRLGHCRDRAR